MHCKPIDGKEQIECSQTLTEIRPKLGDLKTRAEVIKMAAQDGFDLASLETMCREIEPVLAYIRGEVVKGKKITDEKIEDMRRDMAAKGLGYNSLQIIDGICKSPSMEGAIDLMMEVQRAEKRVCVVSSLRVSHEEIYKFDRETGTYMANGVVSDACDQFSFVEIIYPEKGSLALIEKYVEKKTFIQNVAEGEQRQALNCQKRDYSDRVFVSERVYFPLECVSFVYW